MRVVERGEGGDLKGIVWVSLILLLLLVFSVRERLCGRQERSLSYKNPPKSRKLENSILRKFHSSKFLF